MQARAVVLAPSELERVRAGGAARCRLSERLVGVGALDAAGLYRLHVVADGLDDADELVSHAAAAVGRLHRSVWPEIAAADPRTSHANERVSRFDQVRVRDVLDTDVTCAVHHRCTHRFRTVALQLVPEE